MEWGFCEYGNETFKFRKTRGFDARCKDRETVQRAAFSHVVYLLIRQMDHAESQGFTHFVDARSKHEVAKLSIHLAGDNATRTQPALSVTHSANLIDAAT